jgi:alcohol dehydrogenase
MQTRFNTFSIARLPRIEFGRGVFAKAADLCARYGHNLLLVTGAKSFKSSALYQQLLSNLKKQNIYCHEFSVAGEPSPQLVDDAVSRFSDADIQVVLAVGGGSALDAAKAIAGLLRVGRSVMDYLEGVGPELAYQGPAVPFIAVPTTAGTGSEATKNAVLSVQGPDGFKKSFRDDRLVAEYALVDPDLLASCPAEVVAANGMDALTQLLESYVSLKANPMTDALAIDGLRAARDGLLPMYENSGDVESAREKMAYASMLSGICLAQTGLGSVHGLASPLGAFYPIPHGVVCGSLVAEATAINIDVMLQRDENNPALDKYARLGEVLKVRHFDSKREAWLALCDLLREWTGKLQLPRLSHYGVEQAGLDQVVAHSRGSSMKTNPILLSDDEIKRLVLSRL